MNMRWEVAEDQWVRGFSESGLVAYLTLDLAGPTDRAWLESARTGVELIGRAPELLDARLLDRALELDVDFLCASRLAPEVNPKRLPLRLIVEEPLEGIGERPSLFGAAWARRVLGWEGSDLEPLAGLTRRERIFLGPTVRRPERRVFETVSPFAACVPGTWSVAELEAYPAV